MTATAPIVRAMGESAVLVEVPDARAAVALYGRLRESTPPWVVELVPAARTVLLVFDRARIGRSQAHAWLTGGAGRVTGEEADGQAVLGDPVEIPTRYDGPDLAEVAALLGLDVDALIRRHTRQLWTSAFIGFAPGFAYLMGEDDNLAVPRRATPRPVVPAGSVALAAGFCGIYPRASPGGWHLIGSTEAPLWDATREQPALLAPGTRVRFVREQ